MRLSVAEPENKFLNTSLLLLSYERYHNSNSFGNLGMAIITLRVSAGIQGTRATFQWLRHFKNLFCSRLHYGNKTFEMTAVEWLADQLQAGKELSTVLSQANKLFEQQIKDAVEWGNRKGYDEHTLTCILDEDEDYYNETYKKPLQ
jgi:hypothetical protein